jgi:hypothetical protein
VHLQGVPYQSCCKAPNYTPGGHLFSGPGHFTSTLLIDGWNRCIGMFSIQHKWVEADVKRYL